MLGSEHAHNDLIQPANPQAVVGLRIQAELFAWSNIEARAVSGLLTCRSPRGWDRGLATGKGPGCEGFGSLRGDDER